MGLDKTFRFCFLFCLSVVIFVCFNNIQSTVHLNYKLYYTFLLVLLLYLIERQIKADQQDDCRASQKDSGEQTREQARAKDKEVVDRLDHVTLNIAVTGENRAGKTSLFNASYPHLTMANVNISDLLGIGDPKFQAETYMKEVKYYDLFIILSTSRFTENDKKLANEIKKNKKNVYFVRTNKDGKIKEIRKMCLENPPDHLDSFDFQKLIDEKKHAMSMSLPVYSKQSLDEKYSKFKKVAWAVAITSGAIAAIQVPGLATACDVVIVVFFLTKCYHSFGLDDGSLQKLSDRVNKPILDYVKKLDRVREIDNNKSLAMSMVAKLVAAGVVEALCILVPGAGSIAAAAVSVATTRYLLLEGVTELYRVAKRVMAENGRNTVEQSNTHA